MENVSAKIEIEELGLQVVFSADVKMEDHGIGAYECHGYKGNDIHWAPTAQTDATWNKELYSDKENAAINKWLEDNEDEVLTAIENNYTP